jgi:transcriptional regulator with XRE-family HTH domain
LEYILRPEERQVQMAKSIYTREYEILLRLLREARERSGLTQVDLAERLSQTQSYVSKIERGERRLDVVQLRTILGVLGIRLADFVEQFEGEMEKVG